MTERHHLILCSVVLGGVLALLPIVAPTSAQQATPPAAGPPSFEVASVKPNTSGDRAVRISMQPGGRIVAANVPLRELIRMAYGLQDFQIVGTPDWAESERFDINAKAEAGAPAFGGMVPGGPPGPMQLMMQSLLAERFAMRTHPETREQPVYHLVVARSDGRLGPKLRPSSVDCSARVGRGAMAPPQGGSPGPSPGPPPGPLQGGRATPPRPGEPQPCSFMIGPGRIEAGGMPLSQLATVASQRVRRVVVDRTGLTGPYEFTLEFAPDQAALGAEKGPTIDPGGAAPVPSDAPSFVSALQEQLGLKLESNRAPVDVLVIDHVEHPTPD
jgi:bla regulator protein blaR1